MLFPHHLFSKQFRWLAVEIRIYCKIATIDYMQFENSVTNCNLFKSTQFQSFQSSNEKTNKKQTLTGREGVGREPNAKV